MQLSTRCDDDANAPMRSSTPSLRRSFHFVPGPNERMLEKAVSSDADCLILDLEDAVPPKKKDEEPEGLL